MARPLGSLGQVSILSLALSLPIAAQAPDHETTRIADGVYMFRYQAHNSLFIVTGDGVVAFDPISVEAARTYREEIRSVTEESVRAIVYSHHHADHITGAAELATDVPVIAHQRALERLAAEPPPDIVLPNRTFTDEYVLRMGGKTIRLVHLGRNHSDNTIVAHLPGQGIVFVVDFASKNRVAYRDMPDFYLPDLWESLERLQQLDYRIAVFGHGERGTKADVYGQIAYWTDLRRTVESLIQAGLAEDTAVETIELSEYEDWGGYDDWFKMNARTVYRHYARKNAVEGG